MTVAEKGFYILRAKAAEAGTSMADVARRAIHDYVTERPGRLRAAIQRVATEDEELLRRLGQ